MATGSGGLQPSPDRCATTTLSPTITQIHAAPTRAVLYTTGGGAPAIAWLLGLPGASNTVLEARVPYGGERALAAALGAPPAPASASSPSFSGAASREAATALAIAAYRQAAQLAEFGTPIVGIGGAGALATGRERKGGDRFWVAAHDGATTTTAGLSFPKGRGAADRASQDDAAARLLIDALARACGVEGCFEQEAGGGGGSGGVLLTRDQPVSLADPLAALLSGAVATVEVGLTASGEPLIIVDAPRAGRAYLPGSFNPWHAGHGGALAAGAAAVATAAVSPSPSSPSSPSSSPSPHAPQPLAYELAVVNADKGTLDLEVLRGRVAQFLAGGAAAAAAAGSAAPPPPLLLTREPLFAGKARLFSSSPTTKTTWVVGWDTAIRLVDPKYYGGTEAGLASALADLSARGCIIAVVGRAVEGQGGAGASASASGRPSFRAWDPASDLSPAVQAVLPPGLFVAVPEAAFRCDLSSTAIRKERGENEKREKCK